MLVSEFLTRYKPSDNGDYGVTWDHEVDIMVYRALAQLAGFSVAEASYLHITLAMLRVDAESVRDLYDPDREVTVHIHYRINQIPATYKVQVRFFVGDLCTLESLHVVQAASLPC